MDDQTTIVASIADAIREQWPTLDVIVNTTTPTRNSILIYWPFPVPIDRGATGLWIGTIDVEGEIIDLQVIRSQSSYRNVLGDPESLDAIFTILDVHIQDIKEIIEIPNLESGPSITCLELQAKKRRLAYNLVSQLQTKFQIRKY